MTQNTLTKEPIRLISLETQAQYEIQDIAVIGTDPSCTIPFPSKKASTRHARIEKKEDQFILRDLRSTDGTYLNGTRILEAFLQDADIIRLGDTEFRVSQLQEHNDDRRLKSKNSDWDAQLCQLPSVSQTEFPVLLLGPSGAGKDILARFIHDHSERRKGPFVSVNCSALTETLIESELFGHIKGSFTGAITDRKGAFEAARGGTLFLDEIGDLPYGLQAKLLRALENNEIRPVGSDRNVQTDVRIVAATHQNLTSKIEDQQFRSDLYFRLNVINLRVPSLKERMEDFDDLFYSIAKIHRVRFSFTAIQQLKEHHWPGNIRELKNVILRASAFYPKQSIEPEHINRLIDKVVGEVPHQYKTESINRNASVNVIKEIERQMIIKRLAANQGNQRRTAADLGIPKSTLHDRLKIYNIKIDDFKAAEQQP